MTCQQNRSVVIPAHSVCCCCDFCDNKAYAIMSTCDAMSHASRSFVFFFLKWLKYYLCNAIQLFRLGPIWDESGNSEDRGRNVLKHYFKVPRLSHFVQIWPAFGQNLTSLRQNDVVNTEMCYYYSTGEEYTNSQATVRTGW